MNRTKILMLPDGDNWIVDRNCQALVNHLPEIEFTVRPYNQISPEAFIKEANKHDLVHYFNWGIMKFKQVLPQLTKPLVLSVRSHRYNRNLVYKMYRRDNTWLHVINSDLLKDFPNATYIPNGIFDQFKPDHAFTVGFEGYNNKAALDYKGFDLIKEACARLRVKFKPALNDVPIDAMPDYYKSINVYVCASIAEGFSTAVMECLAMNIPVVTTDTGVPRQFDLVKVPRTVEGIMTGIQRFYTQDLVKEYRWAKLAPKYKQLYDKILDSQ